MNGHYYEVVCEGHHDFIKGFIRGLIAGRGIRGEAYFGDDLEIDDNNALTILARLAGMRGEHTVVIAEVQVYDMLMEIVASQGRVAGLRIVSVRRVKEAFFTFSIHTFSREIGKELDRILAEASSVLRIVPPYAPREQEIPEGRGVEAYAPLHDYEFKAQGRISGEGAELFQCYEKLKRYEVVELGPVEIVREK
jgi:hypothetical protein